MMELEQRIKEDLEKFNMDSSLLGGQEESPMEVDDDMPEFTTPESIVADIAPRLKGIDESSFPELILRIAEAYENLKLSEMGAEDAVPAGDDIMAQMDNLS